MPVASASTPTAPSYSTPRPPTNAWSRPLQQQTQRNRLVASTPNAANNAKSTLGAKPVSITPSPRTVENSHNKLNNISSASRTAAKGGPNSNVQNVLRDRFLQLLQNMVGQNVTITQTNGCVIEGVFHTFTPFSSGNVEMRNKYVIKSYKVVKETESGGKKIENGGTIILPAEKVSHVVLKSMKMDNHFNGPSLSGSDSNSFKTDVEISNSNGHKKKEDFELVAAGSAWTTAPLVGRFDSLKGSKTSIKGQPSGLQGNIGEWDQFRANEQLFSVRASFDEDMYTTRLDKSQIDAQQAERAERIAREIESTGASNPHIAEERGQKQEGDYDEEDKYSGVARINNISTSAWRSKTVIANAGIKKDDEATTITKPSDNNLTPAVKAKEMTLSEKVKAKPVTPSPAQSTTKSPTINTQPPKINPPPLRKNYASVAAAAAAVPPPQSRNALKPKITPAVRPTKPKVPEKPSEVKETTATPTIHVKSDISEPSKESKESKSEAAEIKEAPNEPSITDKSEDKTEVATKSNEIEKTEEVEQMKEKESEAIEDEKGQAENDKSKGSDSVSTEKKKPVSKLNANAKAFTFNPSAASFTPSNFTPTTPQPAVENATNSTSVQYMPGNGAATSGMVPMMNSQFSNMRYQNYYNMGGQPFQYQTPQHMPVQPQLQQQQASTSQSEDGEQKPIEQGQPQPQAPGQASQAQTQQQMPPYAMQPNMYYANNSNQQAMMHPRGSAPIQGFVPGQQQMMNPHHVQVMQGGPYYRAMYAPHMHQQQPAHLVQQMPHPSPYYQGPNMQGNPSPHYPPSYVNLNVNQSLEDNDPNFRRNRSINNKNIRRSKGRSSGRGSGRNSYNAPSPNPTSTTSIESGRSNGEKVNGCMEGSKQEKETSDERLGLDESAAAQ